jgi:ATP/ADP translocase
MNIPMSQGLKVAVAIISLIFVFLAGVVFVPTTPEGNEHAKAIVQTLLSVLLLLVGYYWGASSKGTNTPVDEAAIDAAKTKAATVVEITKKEEVKNV